MPSAIQTFPPPAVSAACTPSCRLANAVAGAAPSGFTAVEESSTWIGGAGVTWNVAPTGTNADPSTRARRRNCGVPFASPETTVVPAPVVEATGAPLKSAPSLVAAKSATA